MGSTHSIDAHIDDYFYYGGYDGIITMPSNYIVKDMVIGGISYFHWFDTSTIPVIFNAGVKVGLKGKQVQDIYNGNPYAIETSPSISFSEDVDIIGSMGLGFSIRNTDLLVGLAVDNRLSTSLFIEVR